MQQIIHVDLDAIMDTRLATLFALNPSYVDEALSNGYHTRLIDDWTLITSLKDNQLFKTAYANRNIETLKHSRMTGIVLALDTILSKMIKDNISNPLAESFVVRLNFYPYNELTYDDRQTYIKWFSYYLHPTVGIEEVYIPTKEITPKHIDDNYGGFIIYNLEEWCKHHIEALANHKIPTVSLFAPALHSTHVPTKKEMQIASIGEMTGPQAFEYMLTEYLEVTLLDAKYFSVVDPSKV